MHCSLLEGGILDMHIWDSAQLVLAENEAFFFLHLPSRNVSWLEIIFFIKRRLLLLLWEVQDLTLETCLYRHAVRSRLFIMIQDHYYTPTTPFSLWPNEVILIWVELNRGDISKLLSERMTDGVDPASRRARYRTSTQVRDQLTNRSTSTCLFNT